MFSIGKCIKMETSINHVSSGEKRHRFKTIKKEWNYNLSSKYYHSCYMSAFLWLYNELLSVRKRVKRPFINDVTLLGGMEVLRKRDSSNKFGSILSLFAWRGGRGVEESREQRDVIYERSPIGMVEFLLKVHKLVGKNSLICKHSLTLKLVPSRNYVMVLSTDSPKKSNTTGSQEGLNSFLISNSFVHQEIVVDCLH